MSLCSHTWGAHGQVPSESSTGKDLCSRSLVQLLTGLSSHRAVGLRASGPISLFLMPLISYQMQFPFRASCFIQGSKGESANRVEVAIICNVILKGTSHLICHSLLLRNKMWGSYNYREGITQGREHQEMGISGDIMDSVLHTLWMSSINVVCTSTWRYSEVLHMPDNTFWSSCFTLPYPIWGYDDQNFRVYHCYNSILIPEIELTANMKVGPFVYRGYIKTLSPGEMGQNVQTLTANVNSWGQELGWWAAWTVGVDQWPFPLEPLPRSLTEPVLTHQLLNSGAEWWS